MKKMTTLFALAALSLPLTGCFNSTLAPAKDRAAPMTADTVVYGKIYTSKAKGDYAEAFAVKDGKYVYVGTAAGVKNYIQAGKTHVIDRREKGLVIAGATEGHGHYLMAAALVEAGFYLPGASVEEILKNMKAHVAKYPNKSVYFVQGWETGGKMQNVKFTYNMRKALDAICPDKPILMMDNVGHNAFLNTKAFEMAGFTRDTRLEGGEFAKDKNGDFLGLVSDVAVNYAMDTVIAKNKVISEDEAKRAVLAAADTLHANGYTNYFDAYTNMLGAELYAAVKTVDEKEGLTFNMISSYKIDPYAKIDDRLSVASDFKKKYSSKHFQANAIKLFADGGAVEVKTGWMLEPYADGSHGNQVWPPERFDEITKKANAMGLSVHVHASGDGGTKQAVDSFVKAESTAAKGIYNGIAHSRHITEATKEKMAQHGIYSATNICWRYELAGTEKEIRALMDYDLYMDGYPMKSLLNKGIVMTSSTDYPANDGAPIDIAAIIELGVNGTLPDEKTVRMKASEYLTVEEMLEVLTINGAKQFRLEAERGSIEVGKYADFLFLTKDITTCEKEKIHEAKVDTVYFEGKKVYELK